MKKILNENNSLERGGYDLLVKEIELQLNLGVCKEKDLYEIACKKETYKALETINSFFWLNVFSLSENQQANFIIKQATMNDKVTELVDFLESQADQID